MYQRINTTGNSPIEDNGHKKKHKTRNDKYKLYRSIELIKDKKHFRNYNIKAIAHVRETKFRFVP